MKTCSKCKIEKELTEFYFNKKRDSFEASCKPCRQKSVEKYLENNDNLKHIFYSRVSNIKARINYELEDDFRDYLIELWNKQNGKCFYSGVDMILKGYGKNINNAMTIDRVDSSRGYVKGNVVLCCSIINKMKQNLTIEELINWCDLIKNYKK